MAKQGDPLDDKLRILADQLANDLLKPKEPLTLQEKIDGLKALGDLRVKLNRGRPADPPGSAFNEYRKQVASAGRTDPRGGAESPGTVLAFPGRKSDASGNTDSGGNSN